MAKLKITRANGEVSEHKITPGVEYGSEHVEVLCSSIEPVYPASHATVLCSVVSKQVGGRCCSLCSQERSTFARVLQRNARC